MADQAREKARRSIRLPEYDYREPGAYFVTICTHQRESLFGRVEDGEMAVNEAGAIVQACWNDLPNHYPHVELDAFVVMPNHVHAVIVLIDDVGAGFKPAPTPAVRPATRETRRQPLSEIVRGFKTFSARRINALRGTPGRPVWQRNYYEHVIRGERSLDDIRQYILNNPAGWDTDRENPAVEGTAA